MFSIKHEKMYVKILLIAIIAIYLGLCFASFAYHGDSLLMGNFETFNNDDVKYLRSAWTLIDTGKYTYKFVDKDTVFIMPGLTTVLAGFVLIFGKFPLVPFRIFQAILLAGGLYFVFLIGRKIFSSNVALIATALMAMYSPSIYSPNTIFTESIYYFLFLLAFLYTTYALDAASLKYYALGGVFLGLAALFRPTILLFPIVVFIMWLIKKYSVLDMIICGGMVIGIVALILSPWIIRNAIIFHRFIPLTISSGNPTMQGTFIDYDQSVRATENIDYYEIIKAEGKIDISNFGKDEIITDEAETEMAEIRVKKLWKEDPVEFIKWYTVGKTYENWRRPFLFKNIFDIDAGALLWQHRIYMLAGILGFIIFAFKGKLKGLAWLPVVSIIYFNCSHLPFFCFARYMFPIIFCVVFFGAFLLYELSQMTINLTKHIKNAI